MKRTSIYLLGLACITIIACSRTDIPPIRDVEIPDFNFPQTIVFEQNLSAYGIFAGSPNDLIPSDDYHLLELSSSLFTDYAHKQRLVKVPLGTQMTKSNDGSIDFPEGTILTKTFFYYHDERDTSSGKRIIETRLLIKESNTWNVATYLWNQTQTDAILDLDGEDTQISWIGTDGSSRSTLYHVPNRNECMTCHQSNSTMTPLGPTLRNLNRTVERNGVSLNQINHLQSLGVLNDFQVGQIAQMVDYNNRSASLTERGRAYLSMNCSHCHNPGAWDAPAEREFDFRYETPLNQTGILYEEDRIVETVLDRQMPLIGTTILDQEGINLIIEFLESL